MRKDLDPTGTRSGRIKSLWIHSGSESGAPLQIFSKSSTTPPRELASLSVGGSEPLSNTKLAVLSPHTRNKPDLFMRLATERQR